MKKIVKGKLYNKIEILGNKKYYHVGFEGENENFGDLIESFVPQIGMEKK